METLHALISLHNKQCALFHIASEPLPQAVDFIVFGQYQIPVCRDCVEALSGNDWVLLFCLRCLESRWVCRKLSKRFYIDNIMWLKECPECTK